MELHRSCQVAPEPPAVQSNQWRTEEAARPIAEAESSHLDAAFVCPPLPDHLLHCSEHLVDDNKDGCNCKLLDVVEPWLLTPSTLKNWLFFLVFWGIMIGGGVYAFIVALPKLVDHVVDPAIAAIEEHLSRVVIGLIVTLAVCLLPITIVLSKEPAVWLAAMVFRFWEALLMIEVGTTLGMLIPYWLSRHYLRRHMLRFLSRYRYTTAVMLGVRKAGPIKVVLLMRLGPVPYPVTNYICGIPKEITFWKYLAASLIGKLPGNVLGVLFGRSIKGLAALMAGEEVPAVQVTFNLVSLCSGILILSGGFWYARRALRQLDEEAQAELQAVREWKEQQYALWQQQQQKGQQEGAEGQGEGAEEGRKGEKGADGEEGLQEQGGAEEAAGAERQQLQEQQRDPEHQGKGEQQVPAAVEQPDQQQQQQQVQGHAGAIPVARPCGSGSGSSSGQHCIHVKDSAEGDHAPAVCRPAAAAMGGHGTAEVGPAAAEAGQAGPQSEAGADAVLLAVGSSSLPCEHLVHDQQQEGQQQCHSGSHVVHVRAHAGPDASSSDVTDGLPDGGREAP